MTGQAVIVQGDALHLPLPDASVDLIVTSPPYFALRSYSAGPGEIGSEPTPQAFLEALWAATAEMVRVLKPSGSIFVNLGDKYNSAASGQNGTGATTLDPARGPKMYAGERGQVVRSVPAKSLMLLPERYRIGCVDRLGLIARAVIVWQKVNGLPESVTDRVRRSHEDWVHLTRGPRYYSATDEIREATGDYQGPVQSWQDRKANGEPGRQGEQRQTTAVRMAPNPLGKLPGSVWSIPSEPLRLPEHLGVQHYAAFPSEWPRRLILGWSPPGICLDCGQGRVPVVERETHQLRPGDQAGRASLNGEGIHGADRRAGTHVSATATILGYACGCTPHTNHPGSGESSGEGHSRPGEGVNADGYPIFGDGNRHNDLRNRPRVGPWREYHLDRWTPPPTRPAVVCDPFSGTGTTPMVARALGRIGIGIDLSMPYCKAGRWRVRHDGDKAVSRTWVERQGSLL